MKQSTEGGSCREGWCTFTLLGHRKAMYRSQVAQLQKLLLGRMCVNRVEGWVSHPSHTTASRLRLECQALPHPVAQLCDDGFTAAQAKVILDTTVLQLPNIEGTNLRSGYFRTLNHSKIFDVPWPNDFVYKFNGKKAPFDNLWGPEFVMGYCHIVEVPVPMLFVGL